MTRFECSITSFSRHPALIVPVVFPLSEINIRAPGRRYDDPSTLTIVASAHRSSAATASSNASTNARTSFIRSLGSLQQFVRCDRKFTDTSACRMENSIRDRRRDPDHSELAHSFHAQRIHDLVIFLYEDRLDLVYVGVDRNVIVLQVRIHDP